MSPGSLPPSDDDRRLEATIAGLVAGVGALVATPFVVLWAGAFLLDDGGGDSGGAGLGLLFLGVLLAPVMAVIAFLGVRLWVSGPRDR